MLFNWLFKKSPEDSPPAPRISTGLFSTDILIEKTKSQQPFAEVLKRSFQIPVESVRAVGPAGETTGMDATMQEVKLLNSGVNEWIPSAQVAWYAGQGFIGYQTAAMLAQNWLIDKVCTMPARDACRHGYELTVNDGTEVDPDILSYIRKQDKKFGIKRQCTEFVRFGRIFGIRIAMFMIEGIDYEAPFNPDGIAPGSYKGISQIDPYWITPVLDQQAASKPASPDFYEPTWWTIGNRRIHRTHLIITRNGDEMADILKPSYLYGGVPVPQKIMERVYAAERTANEGPMLTMSKRLTVLKCDAGAAVANLPAFESKMSWWTNLMNNFGVKIIGDDEEVSQFETSLADIDTVIMTQFQLVCAAGEVPATKLLGTTPKGFSATGEYDESSYHESLETIQEHDMAPLIERHHICLMRSAVMPKFSLATPIEIEIDWNATDSPTAKELADRNKVKADTDKVWADAGAIDGTDIRNRLIADKDSGYNGIDPVVPGGPGDRDAEQERQEQELNNQKSGQE